MAPNLIVERADEELEDKTKGRDRTCLRINVPDVKACCVLLDQHGIAYQYGENSWGTVAKFRNPDGNLNGFRSDKEHQEDRDRFS